MRERRDVKDILICGGGIAGLALASCLERRGFRPVVVEKSPGLRDAGHMIDFWGPGYDAAERMGFLPSLRAVEYDIARMTFVDRHGAARFSVRLDALRQLYDGRILNVLRGDLERLLYEQIKDRVEVRFGTSVERVEQATEKARVDFTDGRTAEYDLVVGADGVHSRVRSLVFGAEKQFSRFVGYVVASFILDDPTGLDVPPDAFYTLTLPRRQVNVYPLNRRMATLFIHRDDNALPPDPSRDGKLRALSAAYEGIGWIVPELLERARRVPDLYVDRTEQIILPAWSAGRVTLVGDAGGCVSLLAGQGASLAIAEAYVLADELARGDDLAAALARYEARLKPIVLKSQAEGRNFAGWFVPDNRARIVLRDLMMRLANVSSLSPVMRRVFPISSSIKF